VGVIGRLIRRLNDTLGISSIVVSHDITDLAKVSDRSFLIADGCVAASGSPKDLSKDSSEMVKQFMHGLPDGPVAFHYDAPDYEKQLIGDAA
jgi:phospholipid/cholesterol/gamma-HCH transport system ATP-binding protein